MATPQRSGMTGEEFLAWEAEQDGKHTALRRTWIIKILH